MDVVKKKAEIQAESIPDIKSEEWNSHRFFRSGTDKRDIGISASYFPPGLVRPWNAHERDQYVWLVSGKGFIISEKEKKILEPNMAILIPAGVKHRHGAVTDSHFLQLNFMCRK